LTCQCTGWIGVGWNTKSEMDGADALAGSVSGSTTTLIAYKLTGHSPSASSDIVLTNIVGSEIGGVTTIYFTRGLNNGSHPLRDEFTTLIGAYSPDTDGFGYHGSSTHSLSTVQANFYSGATLQSTNISFRDIHAIIMFIAWGLLLPFGALWARYARHLPNAIWFKVHRVTQYGGFVISLGGIILGYVMVSEQFRVLAHSIIGTVILFLSAAQVVAAFFRPHKQENEPITTARKAFEIFHHWNGRGLLLVAAVQIYLGIFAIGYFENHFWVIIMWSVVVGFVLLVVIIMEVIRGVTGKDDDEMKHVEMT